MQFALTSMARCCGSVKPYLSTGRERGGILIRPHEQAPGYQNFWYYTQCAWYSHLWGIRLWVQIIVLFMYRTFPIHRIKILPACSNYSFPRFRRGQIEVLRQRKPRVGVQIAHFTQSQLQYTVAIRATTLTSSAHMRTLSSILHVMGIVFVFCQCFSVLVLTYYKGR